MKTLFFTLIASAILVFCGTSFFVPQTQSMEDTAATIAVLSDVEMGSKNGGYGDWRSELTRSGSGSFANCSQSPCPTGTYSRTFGHYRCAPCEGTESTYTRTYTTKVEKSWCVSFTEPDGCQYRHYTTEYQWSCVAYTGTCGSDS